MSWTPERWRRLEPHLDKLLDLPESDRAAYLDGLPEEDLELRVDIERLLAASEGEDLQSLSTRAPNLLGAVADEEAGPDPLLTRTLGAYRLLERIGSGGMGLVYRAERMDDAYRQEVAVKVLRWTAGPDLVRRFQRERETLALLDHPNVTRILDGGVSDDGISYLVMELVHGDTITAHSQSDGLKIRDRVKLFLAVCDAVHTAHQRLIVHRDLKPSNVIVAEDGTVKVLDFGIAKWLEEDDTVGGVLLTRTGDRYLTPQYASPEQFRGEAVTTASDVYALGLLLYEILTGKPPYELEGQALTVQDRLICEDAPPSPASVSTESGIRGDLERVVMKAIRKEPERRYHSAEALADDLRAWLDGHPVSATPDSRGYRFNRFVSRNRIGVAAGAAIAIALIVGLVGMTWQAGVASRERDRAQMEAEHSQEVVTFLLEAIGKASRWESAEEVTVAQLLDASAERVDTDLQGQPDVQLQLLLTIGKAYAHTERIEESIRLFDRAVALADSMHGSGSVQAARGTYQKGRSMITLGDPDSAIVLYDQAEKMLRPREDLESRLLLASVLDDIGVRMTEDPDSSHGLHREALAIRESLLDPPHVSLAYSYHYISAALSGLNDPSAPQMFARAADMWRKTVGDPNANLASTLNNWALWHQNQGNVDSASVLYRESLEMQVKIHGESSPSIATTLINIGNFYMQAERYDEALEMLERALANIVPARGDVTGTGAAYANLGQVRFFLEDYPACEEAYNEARRIFVKVFGEDHVYPAVIDVYLGRLYWKWELDAEARSRFASGLGKFQAVHPAVARREGPGRVWQGRFLMERGDLEQAEEVLRRGLELCEDQFSEDQWDRAEASAALGICLIKSGDRDEGLPLLREGHDALSRIRGPEHPMTIWAAEARAKAEAGA